MRLLLLALILLVLSVSCVSRRLVILHNPETKDTAKCEMNSMSTSKSLDACVEGYEKSGYKIMSEE